MKNFTAITELPGSRLNSEQYARITQRYWLAAALAQDKDVLEVSCGAGMGLSVVQQPARSLLACDYTYEVLAAAHYHHGGRVPLLCADAQNLPYADGSFDLVLSYEAIYYLAHMEHFLWEARRLLREEGVLLIGTSNPDWPHFAPGQLSTHYPSVPELASELARAGFEQVQFWGALPTAQATWRRQLVAALRKVVLRQPWFPIDSTLARSLQRMAYGRTIAAPAVLPPAPPGTPVVRELTPIPATQPDTIHRVLYVLAHVTANPAADLISMTNAEE